MSRWSVLYYAILGAIFGFIDAVAGETATWVGISILFALVLTIRYVDSETRVFTPVFSEIIAYEFLFHLVIVYVSWRATEYAVVVL